MFEISIASPLIALRKSRSELQTNRRRHLGHLPGCTEPSCPLIKSKDDDVVGFLIGHQQKCSGRIDSKVARRQASSRFVTYGCQRTVARVNLENSNAVVPTIRRKKKLAIRGDVNISAGVRPGEILRQSCYGL